MLKLSILNIRINVHNLKRQNQKYFTTKLVEIRFRTAAYNSKS